MSPQHPATLPEVSGIVLERKKSSLFEVGASYVTASSCVSLTEVDGGLKSAYTELEIEIW